MPEDDPLLKRQVWKLPQDDLESAATLSDSDTATGFFETSGQDMHVEAADVQNDATRLFGSLPANTEAASNAREGAPALAKRQPPARLILAIGLLLFTVLAWILFFALRH